MYDPKSLKAEEFIDHSEILDTLAYADAHKADAALIDSILEKARLRKGLSHREASVLLACELEEMVLIPRILNWGVLPNTPFGVLTCTPAARPASCESNEAAAKWAISSPPTLAIELVTSFFRCVP